MSTKSKKAAIKERIEYLESEIDYNEAPGVHTYTRCKCGRQSSRSGRCTLCFKEEIEKLKQELKNLK